MGWKKNVLGAIFSAAGLLGSAAALWVYSCAWVRQLGITDQTFAMLAGAGIPAVSLILFLIIWIPGRSRRKTAYGDQTEKAGISWNIAEGILFICLIAAGIALRMLNIQYAGESAAYYDAAMVKEGGSMPQVAHGAAYFYIQLLHLLFLILGNKWIAGIWLQIVLQMTGCILMYLAVRRLSGSAAALTLAAFMMLTPGAVLAGLTYSPDMMYLCIYAVGLLCVASFLKKRAAGMMNTVYDAILLVFAGAWVALACYLDLLGITLLLFVLSAAGLYVNKSRSLWENTAFETAVFLLSVIAFFAAYLGLDAYSCGKSFLRILYAWLELYQVKGFYGWFWYSPYDQAAIMILLFFMVWAALGYFSAEKIQRITPWICVTAAVCAMGCFQMNAPDMGYFDMLCYFAGCLAGTGIAACLPIRKADPSGEKPLSKEEKDMQPEQILSETEENRELPKKPVKFIENPLPLPKKPVRKTPEYGFIPDESQMNYDIEVDENDDFDI